MCNISRKLQFVKIKKSLFTQGSQIYVKKYLPYYESITKLLQLFQYKQNTLMCVSIMYIMNIVQSREIYVHRRFFITVKEEHSFQNICFAQNLSLGGSGTKNINGLFLCAYCHHFYTKTGIEACLIVSDKPWFQNFSQLILHF